MFALLLAPFAVFLVFGVWRGIYTASRDALGPRRFWGRSLDRRSGGDVELHGVGQRFYSRSGS